MRLRSLRAALVGAALVLTGCYTVGFHDPVAQRIEPPLFAGEIEIPRETREFRRVVRSFEAGIGNRWTIPVGETLVRYSDALLQPAIRTGDAVVRIEIRDYRMRSFQATLDTHVLVRDGAGRTVLDRDYSHTGSPYRERTTWGGAFAMKSSMRRTTDDALRAFFEELVTDLRALDSAR